MGSEDTVHRGMELAARRPEVMPDEAGPRIQPVYEEIQRTLRVPFVNLIFRTLANDPDYLVPAWNQLAPVLRTLAFERAADRLRAAAVLRSVPDTSEVEWSELAPMERVRAFNDTIHYVLPKLLLIAAVWDEGRCGDPGSTETIPTGVAEGTAKESMVPTEDAEPRVRELYRREREAHGHPLVSSYYRVLANWPDLLDALWTRLEAVVGTPEFRARRDALSAMADGLLDELPLDGHIEGAARTEDVSALLTAFRREFIPSMMVDVALVKGMLDGEQVAPFSRFSASAADA